MQFRQKYVIVNQLCGRVYSTFIVTVIVQGRWFFSGSGHIRTGCWHFLIMFFSWVRVSAIAAATAYTVNDAIVAITTIAATFGCIAYCLFRHLVNKLWYMQAIIALQAEVCLQRHPHVSVGYHNIIVIVNQLCGRMIRIRPSFFIDNNHYSTELREASSTLGDSIVVVSRVAENGANFRRAH